MIEGLVVMVAAALLGLAWPALRHADARRHTIDFAPPPSATGSSRHAPD